MVIKSAMSVICTVFDPGLVNIRTISMSFDNSCTGGGTLTIVLEGF
jgi:hypothetical protein